jgi:hypothetical protein
MRVYEVVHTRVYELVHTPSHTWRSRACTPANVERHWVTGLLLTGRGVLTGSACGCLRSPVQLLLTGRGVEGTPVLVDLVPSAPVLVEGAPVLLYRRAGRCCTATQHTSAVCDVLVHSEYAYTARELNACECQTINPILPLELQTLTACPETQTRHGSESLIRVLDPKS